MKHAFVIEDDYDASTIFCHALTERGYEVEAFHDGQEALDRLAAEPAPHLVLLDLYLPSVNGADILHYIRQTEHLAVTKVIIVTANPRMADDLKGEADLVILKPSSYSQIRGFIARFDRRHS